MDNKRMMTIYFDKELKRRLVMYCFDKNKSQNTVIMEAIKKLLDEKKV